MHYRRWKLYGDPLTVKVYVPQGTPEERFLAHIEQRDNGCVVWTAAPDRQGYGRFGVGGKIVLAHRWGYQYFVGPVPDGLELDHLCRNTMCVNPAHLEPVTHRENMLRSPVVPAALNARKTHCPAGHEYNADNTRMEGARRRCRICQRENVRRYRERKASR